MSARTDDYLVRLTWHCCHLWWSAVWECVDTADARTVRDECVVCGRIRRPVELHRLTADEVDTWRRRGVE